MVISDTYQKMMNYSYIVNQVIKVAFPWFLIEIKEINKVRIYYSNNKRKTR